jgi:hypothetical protein
MHTYCEGYSLIANKDVTKGDLIYLCEELKARFEGKESFRPEGISEGGIVFDTSKYYKSMRMHLRNWPWIDNIDSWIDNKDIIIHSRQIIRTTLKSTCIPWTKGELALFELSFQSIGLYLYGNHYPTEKNLEHYLIPYDLF